VGVSRKVVFAEQFYYPEGWGGAQLPRDLTMELARAGWDVEVVCGSDQYAPTGGEPVPDPTSAGVKIRRIPRLLSGDIHRLKLLRQLWFYVMAFPMLLLTRCSVYVTQTNPPLIVPIVALVAALRRRPLVIIAQDIYPEVMWAHGMIDRGSFSAKLLAKLFRWAYRRAVAVVSLGPTMSERLREKGVAPERIVEISNWATGEQSIVRGEENRLRSAWGLDGKVVLLYSGNLGIAHDIETPLRAIAAAREHVPELTFVIIGKGSRLQQARQLAEQLKLGTSVQFRDLVPFELLPHTLGLADMALVTLGKGFEGLVVPSKALGYMARGVPTLYIGPPSDISSLLEQSGGGSAFANGEVQAVANGLRELLQDSQRLLALGAGAQRFYDERLDRAMALKRYAEMLTSVVHAHK